MAGARAAIQYQKEHLGDRQQQQRNVATVKSKLTAIGIPVIPNPSHIVPLLVGNAEQAKAASDLLLTKHKLYVQSINFPTVAIGSERLRITPSPLHSEAQLQQLVEALNDVWNELGLKRSHELVGRKELAGTPVNLWTPEQLALEDQGGCLHSCTTCVQYLMPFSTLCSSASLRRCAPPGCRSLGARCRGLSRVRSQWEGRD